MTIGFISNDRKMDWHVKSKNYQRDSRYGHNNAGRLPVIRAHMDTR